MAAAIAVLERNGLAHFTMRTVGVELGVTSMSLYRYVNGRADLLNAMAAHLVDQLFTVPRALNPPKWRLYLIALADDIQDAARHHPETTVLLLTMHQNTFGVRVPFGSPQSAEICLRDLHRCGLSDIAVATAYQAFCSFVVGQLFVDLADARGTYDTPSEHPLLRRIGALVVPVPSSLQVAQHLDRLDLPVR